MHCVFLINTCQEVDDVGNVMLSLETKSHVSGFLSIFKERVDGKLILPVW